MHGSTRATGAFTVTSALLAIALSACSTGSPLALEPALDVGATTASLAPAPMASPAQAEVATTLTSTGTGTDYGAPGSSFPASGGPDDESESEAATPDMAAMPGMEAPLDAAPVEVQPDAASTLAATPATIASAPAVQVASAASGAPRGRSLQTLVPSSPNLVEPPWAAPKAAPSRRSLSVDEQACRRDLKKLGVVFKELAQINDGGACRIDNPVLVSAIGGVKMKPAATLNCEMAVTFASWTRKELVPSARWRYISGVKTIHQGSSYSCRKIAGSRGVPSEHSRGNALDVMRIELSNGKDIDVRKPGWFAFRQRGLLNNVRADACEYFTTVLGPGYNYDHRNHFHFDIKPRKNGYRACR